jgi:hypothetical protein
MSKKFKNVSKAHRRDFLLLGVAGVTAGMRTGKCLSTRTTETADVHGTLLTRTARCEPEALVEFGESGEGPYRHPQRRRLCRSV